MKYQISKDKKIKTFHTEKGPSSRPGRPACRQAGQALISILFFTLFALTITAAATTVIVINSQSTSKLEQGISAHAEAEAGAENALLRLERNPSYTGETMTIGTATVTISITGDKTKTATISAIDGNFKRTIQIQAQQAANNVLTIQSWKEIF